MVILYADSTQFGIGAFFTGLYAAISGFNFAETLTAAVVIPALIMLLVSAPKFIREAMLLYREYRKPNSTTFDDGDSDA